MQRHPGVGTALSVHRLKQRKEGSECFKTDQAVACVGSADNDGISGCVAGWEGSICVGIGSIVTIVADWDRNRYNC